MGIDNAPKQGDLILAEAAIKVKIARIEREISSTMEDYGKNPDYDYDTRLQELKSELEAENQRLRTLPVGGDASDAGNKSPEGQFLNVAEGPEDKTVALLKANLERYRGRVEGGVATLLDAYKIAITEYYLEHKTFFDINDLSKLPAEIKEVVAWPTTFGLDKDKVSNITECEAALREAYAIVVDYVETGGANLIH